MNFELEKHSKLFIIVKILTKFSIKKYKIIRNCEYI